MERKMFFTDLDETLLTKEKTMTPATIEAVKKLADAGHYLALISGRPLDSIIEARGLLPISDHHLYYVANNGGQIVSAETMETISEIRLTMAETAHLLAASEKADIHCHAYTDNAIVAKQPSPELSFYQRTIHLPAVFSDPVTDALDKPPFKCLAISIEGRSRTEALKASLQAWAEGHVTLICSTENLLEMFPATSGKGAALVRLAEYLQIPLSHTMSAGDQDNDISMLQAAGLGVAMCNGSEGAKAAADIVTEKDNNHDGLVPYLNQFFNLPQ